MLLDKRINDRQKWGVALLIFVSYIILHLVFGRHEMPASDMYTYLSFAEHYTENWFYTQMPGQAHGLQIVSYPPLVFQTMALMSFIPLLNLNTVYVLLMSLGVSVFSLSFYYLFKTVSRKDYSRFYLIVILIAFSTGLMKFVLIHGSITLIYGLTFGFVSIALFYKILDDEKVGSSLILTLALTAYTHPLSFIITILMMGLLGALNIKEVINQIDYLLPVFFLSGLIAFLGLLPMIQEVLFGIIQGQITHGSRNPIRNMDMFTQFLATTYGISIIGLPLLFKQKLKSFDVNVITLSFFILGLGLVTPIPEIVFGGFAKFIVYDRFSLTASLFLTALIGAYCVQIRRKIVKMPISKFLVIIIVLLSIGGSFWANNVFLNSSTGYGDYNNQKSQTAINYLNSNVSEDYLYMTHGHPIPAAEIRRNTDTPTLDTEFYQGRKIEFLSNTGRLNRVSKSKLIEITNKSGQLSLKYVITFDRNSDSWMNKTEWEKQDLENNVTVWINPEPVEKYNPSLGEKRVLFTTAPIIVLIFSMFFAISKRLRSYLELILERFRLLIQFFHREIGFF